MTDFNSLIQYYHKNTFLNKNILEDQPCQNKFAREVESECVVYDNDGCSASEGSLVLKEGEYMGYINPSEFKNGVMSIFVKSGCQLTVWKGIKHFYYL